MMEEGLITHMRRLLPTSLGGLPSITGRDAPLRGNKAMLKMYSTSPWLRAVTNKIGRAVGRTEWKLFVAVDNDGRATQDSIFRFNSHQATSLALYKAVEMGKVREVRNHPLLDLLCVGNEALAGLLTMQLTEQHIDLVGEAFWLIERNGAGAPAAVWPVPPDWIRDIPSRERMSYLVSPEGTGSVEVEIPVSEVIWFKDPDPSNPYGRGTGIARSLADELETDEYAAKHVKNFFYNRARPDLIITGDSFGKEDAERVEKKWKEQHQGFWNSFKPLFINRKVEIKELSQTFENMQLTALRKHERDAIIQVFQIPPESLGILSASNRSTIDAAHEFLTREVVTPRIELLRAVMQQQLVPQFDSRLILFYESPVIEDKEFKLSVMKAAPHAFRQNDWRKLANEAPLANGDRVLVPLNEQLEDAPLVDGSVGAAKSPAVSALRAALPAIRSKVLEELRR